MIRSLGLATDAMLMRGVSELEDRGDHIVWQTPSEPTFWFGNFVMFQSCPEDPTPQIAAFDAAFPEAKHKVIVWDDPAMKPGPGHVALRRMGYEIEVVDVLSLPGQIARAEVPEGIEIRPVSDEAEWQAVIDQQVETGLEEGHDPVGHRPYVEARFATIRGQVATGDCRWFAAWDGRTLAGDLGVMTDGKLARYRSVETAPAYRRRGICAALVCAAHDWVRARAPGAVLVIVAEAEGAAGRIYRRCGFQLTERNMSALLKGY